MRNKYNYFFLRLPIALSLLGHGLVRLPKLQAFSNLMVTSMQKSYLPQPLILIFSYAVPFAEVITGALLLLGIYTRYALYAGLTLMAFFIFGSTTIENWEAITSQLVHAAYLAGLLLLTQYHPSFSESSLKENNK